MFVVSFLLALVAAVGGGANKPNIILFLADDLGYGHVNHNASWGFPTNALKPGSQPIKRKRGLGIISTPQLARMASQGIRATMSFAASPLCAPSRAAIFLERHVGVIDCIRGNLNSLDHELQPTKHLNFVQELAAAGYVTALFGKWGVGSKRAAPWKLGFQHFAGILFQPDAHVYFPNFYYEFTPRSNVNEPITRLQVPISTNLVNPERCKAVNSTCVHINDLVMDKSLEFLQQRVKDKAPFLLVIAPTYPHYGKYTAEDTAFTDKKHGVPTKLVSPNRIKQTPMLLRNYASLLEQHMDRDVGRILDYLESQPLLDGNTLLVFTSDNGPDNGLQGVKSVFKPAGGLRAGKGSVYEGGLRVPTILRWPGVFPSNTVSNIPFVLHDLGPTFREMAGVTPAPQQDEHGMPTLAVSMLQAWKTGKVQSRRYLHFEFCSTQSDLQCNMATMELQNDAVFKHVQIGNTKQLFNLKASPAESKQVKQGKASKIGAIVNARNLLRRQFDVSKCSDD